jgi:hypothetical protein
MNQFSSHAVMANGTSTNKPASNHLRMAAIMRQPWELALGWQQVQKKALAQQSQLMVQT